MHSEVFSPYQKLTRQMIVGNDFKIICCGASRFTIFHNLDLIFSRTVEFRLIRDPRQVSQYWLLPLDEVGKTQADFRGFKLFILALGGGKLKLEDHWLRN